MMRMMKRLGLLLWLALCFTSVWAQEGETPIPERDPAALAASLRGYAGDPPILDVTPRYEPGDTLEFWVGKTSSPTPTRIEARLIGQSGRAYVWVDRALTLEAQDPDGAARVIGQLYTLFRLRSTYRAITIPDVGMIQDSTDQLPVADVDNDPHLYVVFTAGLADDRDVLVNPVDSLPAEYAPSGISNQRETMFVNALEGVPLNDEAYLGAIARGMYALVMQTNNPNGAAWLDETLKWTLLFQVQQMGLAADDYNAFFGATDTPLTQPPSLTTRPQTLAAQQLFVNYGYQRYSDAFFLGLFMREGSGIGALDALFAEQGIYDAVSGAPVTGRDLFADYVIANLLNFDFGDRRYRHTVSALENTQRAQTTLVELGDLVGQTVSQFGTLYYRYSTQTPTSIDFTFTGRETIPRLPMDRDPADRFYWSGQGANQVRTMTRAFDLSGIESAALTFDAWWNTAQARNYGYVAASTDGGATWTILTPDGLSADNRYGAAYGVGFTGISNPQPPRPFPVMGVVIAGDGVTVQEIVPGGAAEAAGVRAGDVIAGYAGAVWTGAPNVIGMLANYAPGDTISLLIQRGADQLEIPVLLGAHPTRVVQPRPLWQPQRVDLTPFVGGEVLIRFMTITLPGTDDQGVALDNIAVPEIGFSDDGAWELIGWSEIDNALPQDMLVQAVTVGANSVPRVQRLIEGTNAGGTWTFPLAAGDTLLIAVSGVSDETRERAAFDLRFERGGA